jgi:hypothetical protein
LRALKESDLPAGDDAASSDASSEFEDPAPGELIGLDSHSSMLMLVNNSYDSRDPGNVAVDTTVIEEVEAAAEAASLAPTLDPSDSKVFDLDEGFHMAPIEEVFSSPMSQDGSSPAGFKMTGRKQAQCGKKSSNKPVDEITFGHAKDLFNDFKTRVADGSSTWGALEKLSEAKLIEKAFRKATETASRSLGEGQYLLSELYEIGFCVRKNLQGAERWLNDASKQGNLTATFRLAQANCYHASNKKNLEGLQMLKELAARGFKEAVPIIGELLIKGQGGINKDLVEAERFLSEAVGGALPRTVAKKSDILLKNVLNTLAKCADRSQNHAERIKWYTKLAERGDAEAQFTLSVMFSDGRVIEKNFSEAVSWAQLAANQGHMKAQRNLGVYYLNGDGVPQDTAESLKWIEMAGLQGDCDIIFDIACRYNSGEDNFPKNATEAARWYEMAAVQGHHESQYALGMMLTKSSQSNEGDKWIIKAADGGLNLAHVHLANMYSRGSKRNFVLVEKHLLKLAAGGNSSAHLHLSNLYERGLINCVDYNNAYMNAQLASKKAKSDEERDEAEALVARLAPMVTIPLSVLLQGEPPRSLDEPSDEPPPLLKDSSGEHVLGEFRNEDVDENEGTAAGALATEPEGHSKMKKKQKKKKKWRARASTVSAVDGDEEDDAEGLKGITNVKVEIEIAAGELVSSNAGHDKLTTGSELTSTQHIGCSPSKGPLRTKLDDNFDHFSTLFLIFTIFFSGSQTI